MRQPHFPPGWDEERVRDVIAHYESQSEEEAVADDEAASGDPKQTAMLIPNELVPAVRELLGKHAARDKATADKRPRFRLFRGPRLRRQQAEEDAPGMRARKYVAMGIVVLTAVAAAVGVGWYIYVGRDAKLGLAGRYLAVPIALLLGGSMAVGGCILIESKGPGSRLRYSLLFPFLAALAWCALLYWA